MKSVSRAGKKYHREGRPLTGSPQDIMEAISRTGDLLLALNDYPPSWLWEKLLQCPSQGKQVTVLFDAFRDVKCLEELYRAKARLFEAALPKGSFLFLDREIGWQVPSFRALAEPFSLSCRLLWARMGAVISVQGFVADLQGDFIRLCLDGGHHLWLCMSNVLLPAGLQPGKDVKVLGVSSFLGSFSNPIVSPLKIAVLEGKEKDGPFP